ncbi:MAG: NTPase [Thermoprotei archaeon]|jgi:nucleoside-triphosphatase
MYYFLTGTPGVGKTTAIVKIINLLKEQNIKVGGFITKELRSGFIRIGFEVEDVMSGNKGILAISTESGEPRIGKYHVRIKEFEDISIRAIENAMLNADVIVCDEIGPMELLSNKFVKLIEQVLETDKNVIGTVHWKANHPLIKKIRNIGKIIEITYYNRNEIPNIIVKEVINNMRGVKNE